MNSISISNLKAKCTAVVRRVYRTRKAILITRFGEPVAQLNPPPTSKAKGDWLGTLSDSTVILGDIVSPASDPDEWEAMRD